MPVFRRTDRREQETSAHFERTVLITDGAPEILTDRPRLAIPEQLGIPRL